MNKSLQDPQEDEHNIEGSPTWEVLVDRFISECSKSDDKTAEALSSEDFRVELEARMKNMVSLFIKKHIKELLGYKAAGDIQEDTIVKLKAEIETLREENEQLNEMSLALINEIKRLKKYIHKSDILVSILRGEMYKQKYQNKLFVNALKQIYEGNEELATKTLTHAFSINQESAGSVPDKVLISSSLSWNQNSPNKEEHSPSLFETQKGFETMSNRERRTHPIDTKVMNKFGKMSMMSEGMSPDRDDSIFNDEEINNMGIELESNKENIKQEAQSFEGNIRDNINRSYNNSKISSPQRKREEHNEKEQVYLDQAQAAKEQESPLKLCEINRLENNKSITAQEVKIPEIRFHLSSKWLKPKKNSDNIKHYETQHKVNDYSRETIANEDKIETFVEDVKCEAKNNTELPIGLLFKMPIIEIKNILSGIFGRKAKKKLEQ